MRSHPRRRARARRGFTLLEIMAVVLIIGILAAFLVPNITDAVSGANASACEANMREVYRMLLSYQANHDGQFPKDEGQRFFLRLWKDGTVERSESNARRFFCPAERYQGFLAEEQTVEDYLNNWDAIGPYYTSYAGFATGGDQNARRQLTSSPSKVTILADAHITHRNTIVYMTADGDVHRLNVSDLVDEGTLTEEEVESGNVPLGPASPIEALRTVTND